MSFRTFIPCDALKPFVKALVITESALPNTYKVLPDTAVVMGFQYTGSLSYSQQEQIIPLSVAGVTGLTNTYKIFHTSKNIATLLILFKDSGASAFFNLPMHEIFGQSVSLDDLVLKSQMEFVCEQLQEGKSDLDRIRIAELFLISLLTPQMQDPLIIKALQLIRATAGNIKILQLSDLLHISQSQLEKRFRKHVGASPKKFASIVRIQTLINSNSIYTNQTQRGLAAGYFDQAHFIKDFKSFTGQNPEDFFKKS